MATLKATTHNETISYDMYESIDLKFEECMQLYMDENGIQDKYLFLDSYTFEQKVVEIIKNLEVELACSMTTIKFLNNK